MSIISDELVVPMKIPRKFVCLTAKVNSVIRLKAVIKSCKRSG